MKAQIITQMEDFRKISSKSVYKAACSFQPLEIITANSLSRVVSPWQAVITLNPIISALNHVFQGLAKNSISYSRLRRIIRAFGFKFHLHSPYRYCHASLLGHCFSNCPRTFSADHIFCTLSRYVSSWGCIMNLVYLKWSDKSIHHWGIAAIFGTF